MQITSPFPLDYSRKTVHLLSMLLKHFDLLFQLPYLRKRDKEDSRPDGVTKVVSKTRYRPAYGYKVYYCVFPPR